MVATATILGQNEKGTQQEWGWDPNKLSASKLTRTSPAPWEGRGGASSFSFFHHMTLLFSPVLLV